jgi:hypothetical protein
MRDDGQGNLFADAETLVFNTSTGAYQVPLSGIGSLARSTVDQASAEIRAAVDGDTQIALSTVNQTINQNKTDIQNTISQLATTTQNIANNVTTISNTIDSPRQSYEALSSNRGTTVQIPEQTIISLCGDSDGCSLRIGMYDWDGTARTASRETLFYYNGTTKTWRSSSGDISGTNGNHVTEHPLNAWSCYFTDAQYTNWVDNSDTDLNFGLMSWNQYVATCRLTIID